MKHSYYQCISESNSNQISTVKLRFSSAFDWSHPSRYKSGFQCLKWVPFDKSLIGQPLSGASQLALTPEILHTHFAEVQPSHSSSGQGHVHILRKPCCTAGQGNEAPQRKMTASQAHLKKTLWVSSRLFKFSQNVSTSSPFINWLQETQENLTFLGHLCAKH